MKYEDVKEGMKVAIPKTKSTGDNIEKSNVIKRAIFRCQNFLFIAGTTKLYGIEGRVILLNDTNVSMDGDFFLAEDITPFTKQLDFDFGD